MKHRYGKRITSAVALTVLMILSQTMVFAGNPDRIGANGADQLLLNPWARSSGYANANYASVTGLDAMYGNVSGLALIDQTQLSFNHTRYLGGSGIALNSGGLAQRIGQAGVLGVSIFTMNVGDIERTTVNQPEGGLGTYRPSFGHIAVSYAREFSNSIYAGATMKVVTEGVPDSRAQGVAFDAGIRYITGKHNNFKFGISLKNVGPKMTVRGDGLSITNVLEEKQFTLEQRSEGFELPAVLNLSLTYDFLFGSIQEVDEGKFVAEHRISPALNFMSNSFGQDQVSVGVEWSFKEFMMIRGGYVYEEGIRDREIARTVLTGPAGGFTLALPMGESGRTIDFDYSYRHTNPFSGIHTIGLMLDL